MSGVDRWIKAKGEVKVNFIPGKVSCNYCVFCRYEEAYRRYSCRLSNDRWIYAPFTGIAEHCPLKFEAEDNEI